MCARSSSAGEWKNTTSRIPAARISSCRCTTEDYTLPARASAAKRLTILAERVHGAIVAHPAVVPLLLSPRHLSLGALQATVFGPLTGTGTAALAEVSAEEYPSLSDTARHAHEVSAEEEFRRGVEIVLRGLGL